MLRLNRQQRAALSHTIRELANFVAAAFVLGQLVAERPRPLLIAAGVVAWAGFIGWALLLEGGRSWKARS